MSDYVIQAEGLGKHYFLGEDTTGLRFRQALNSLAPGWMTPSHNELWAVRNASFAIRAGESVGIIGGNGAGKSTLLKLLARITPPTEGRVHMRGRVGALLEVGTGFHPELTGRDNIFLSGSILGMTRSEVKRKFDEIVDFAELDKFLDTPVKRYSSGMYMRLAFAVAAFLDPEILIVDEVLAVGDAGFQRKSLSRLSDASAREGRTVLFVSHNFHAIRNFCHRVIVLDHGQIVFDGTTEEGLERYLKSIPTAINLRDLAAKDRLNRTTGSVRFTKLACFRADGTLCWQFRMGESVTLRFDYEVMQPVNELMFLLRFRSAMTGETVTTMREIVSATPLKTGQAGTLEITIPKVALRPTELSVYACLGLMDARHFYDVIDSNVDLPFLRITSDEIDMYGREGVISIDYRFRAWERDDSALQRTTVA